MHGIAEWLIWWEIHLVPRLASTLIIIVAIPQQWPGTVRHGAWAFVHRLPLLQLVGAGRSHLHRLIQPVIAVAARPPQQTALRHYQQRGYRCSRSTSITCHTGTDCSIELLLNACTSYVRATSRGLATTCTSYSPCSAAVHPTTGTTDALSLDSKLVKTNRDLRNQKRRSSGQPHRVHA
jgi:hypothetical protein